MDLSDVIRNTHDPYFYISKIRLIRNSFIPTLRYSIISMLGVAYNIRKVSLSISLRGIDDIGIKLFYNGAHCEYLRFQQDISPEVISMRTRLMFPVQNH